MVCVLLVPERRAGSANEIVPSNARPACLYCESVSPCIHLHTSTQVYLHVAHASQTLSGADDDIGFLLV